MEEKYLDVAIKLTIRKSLYKDNYLERRLEEMLNYFQFCKQSNWSLYIVLLYHSHIKDLFGQIIFVL